jgi:hypothetical protein
MSSENKAAIRALRAERRSLITRIQNTEANLAKLRSRLSFTELKLTCFGCNMERLRAAKLPRKMFKGRNIYRRILDLQRKAEKALPTRRSQSHWPSKMASILRRCLRAFLASFKCLVPRSIERLPTLRS